VQCGSSSPLCLESFRPSSTATRCSRSTCHLHPHPHPQQQQQQQQRLLSHRLHATSPGLVTGSDQSSRLALVRGYGALDAERQRRDSGVLIEDPEPGDTDTATTILPMPELIVERIGRLSSNVV